MPQGLFIAISLAVQNFLPFCFAPRLVINVKGQKNRVHMSVIGGGLSNVQLEDIDLPRDIQHTNDFA